MSRFLAHTLFVLAAWTLLIKYAFPIAWSYQYGTPLLSLVWWDFWWVVHLWLGWALLARPAYTYWLAAGTAGVEVIIVVTKFVLFLQAPDWTLWTSNWFINKIFVLAVFSIMLVHIVLAPHQYRPVSDARRIDDVESAV